LHAKTSIYLTFVGVRRKVNAMDCPHCGQPVTCRACGNQVEDPDLRRELELMMNARGPEPKASTPPDKTFLIVAKGHGELLDQLKQVVGDLGWVRLVEDRRQDETILPREGRQGTVHVDRDITP
jgi:hypothetical protein